MDHIDTRDDRIVADIGLHWRAVMGGCFVALGTWLFLLAVGAAIGSQMGKPGPDTWTAVYTLVAPIIALFIGGLVTARSQHLVRGFDGALHAIVLWGVTIAISALLLSTFGSLLMSPARGGQMPAAFAWALAGSILGSLLASLLGTAAVSPRPVRREVAGEAR